MQSEIGTPEIVKGIIGLVVVVFFLGFGGLPRRRFETKFASGEPSRKNATTRLLIF
jgi:hypothetical protein